MANISEKIREAILRLLGHGERRNEKGVVMNAQCISPPMLCGCQLNVIIYCNRAFTDQRLAATFLEQRLAADATVI